MRWILKFLEPGPMDMQSSPVFIILLVMEIPVEDCMCMPSVLGLQLGALIFMFSSVMLWHWSIEM